MADQRLQQLSSRLNRALPAPLPDPGERRRLREAVGLSLRIAANVLEVSTMTLHRWESGDAEPRSVNRRLYAEFLGMLADQLPDSTGAGREHPQA